MGDGEVRGEREDESGERDEWFWSSRLPDDENRAQYGRVIFEASRRKRIAERITRTPKTNGLPPPPAPPGGAGTVNWTPIGPSVIDNGQSAPVRPLVSGRINAIAAGPGNRVYIGAANGGAWYSGDGGLSWTPLDDYASSPSYVSNLEADALAVGGLAVRFGSGAATDDVYVGTGEPGAGDGYFGVGVRHSPAGGAPGTWVLEATNLAGKDIYQLALDPDISTRVWAATTGGIYQRPAAAPFTTWTQIMSTTFVNSNGAVSDFVIGGAAGARAYYAAFRNDKVYRFDGTTWTALTGIAPFAGRIALAVGESDPSVVYALTQSGTLYRLVGTAFQTVANVPGSSIVTVQGGYDLVLGVDPGDASIVYLAGSAILFAGDYALPLFKGSVTSSGGSWSFSFNPANAANPTADPTYVGGGIHADGHSMAFAVTGTGSHDPTNVWLGTDGGLFQSTTSGALNSFTARNLGLAITEMTFFAQRSDSDSTLFAGCQDNGNVRYHGEQACYEDPEGDGGGVVIDPNDAYKVMRQYVRAGTWQQISGTWYFFGALSTTTDGGATGFSDLTFPPWTANTQPQRDAVNAEDAATNFYAPIAAADAGGGATRAAFGTNRVWLTENWGGAWVTLPTATNPYTPATPDAAQDVLDGNPVVSVVFASGTRLFAATRAGVWRFDLAGTTWTRTALTTGGLPAGAFITSLAVADPVAGSVYVALGYSPGGHVYYLDGASGATWSNAGITDSSGAINVPAHAIAYDSTTAIVYVGTDVGVWSGTRSGLTWTWTPFSPGLPECAVLDLKIHDRARLLRAATHGRGIWEVELAPASVADTANPDIYLRVNYADTGRIHGGSRYSWVEGAQDPTAKGFNVYHWMSADIKVRRGSLTGLPVLGSQASYLDYAFNIGDYIDTSHIETADQSGPDRIFVEVHNRGLTPLPAGQVRVLLLITQVGAALPALPASYATHINAGDTATSWLAGTPWKFADPAMPYRVTTGVLDVRTPQVVEFDVDVSTLGLVPGDHVCAAAFITTVGTEDRLTATNTSLDALTMSDKHVAHRNLHLVAAGARPAPPPADGYTHEPQTFLIDFHNASREPRAMNLVFQRPRFPGELSLMLPKLPERATAEWAVHHESKLEAALRSHLAAFLTRLGEHTERLGTQIERFAATLDRRTLDVQQHELRRRRVTSLDRSHIYVARGDSPTVHGVELEPGGSLTAAVTVVAPPAARPGDRFRFDVLQTSSGALLGGVTYILEVTAAR